MCYTSEPIERGGPVESPEQIKVESIKVELLTELTRVISLGIAVPYRFTDNDMNRLSQLVAEESSAVGAMVRDFIDIWKQTILDRTAMSVAYCRLFQGPFEIAAPPYASFYLESDRQHVGSIRRAIESCYRDAGLVAGPGPCELPDHAALQWEFVYYLSYQHDATGHPDWRCRRDDFVKYHLRPWMPAFAQRIRSAGIHAYYDSWAQLALASLQRL